MIVYVIYTVAGKYEELDCIVRNGVKSLPRTPVSKDSVYFVSAFRTDGHIENLERIWRSWSGADYVLWECPAQLKLRRLTFLKATHTSEVFTFIALFECEDGLNFVYHAKELLERLNERWCGMVGLYKVERYYIPAKR